MIIRAAELTLPRLEGVAVRRCHAGFSGPSRIIPRATCSTTSSFKSVKSGRRRISTGVPQRHEASPAAQANMKDDHSSYTDPVSRYEHLVETGVLKPDSHQQTIITKLQRLYNDLKHYDPGEMPTPQTEEISPSFFGKFFSRTPSTPTSTISVDKVPKGLYLYGSVGTGKTMLMDLFHSTLPDQFKEDKYGSSRIHFHSFMLDVLQRQHTVKAKYAKMGAGEKDAMPEVARSLAAEGRVLCFDEFQVTDIVSAMILRQLLERLMGFGVVCVMTSNRHPDELYLNGIQRESFIPAIKLIKEKFEVVDLNSPTDYRKIPRALKKVYYHPLDTSNRQELNKIFTSLASTDPVSTEIHTNVKLKLWGRELIIPESTGTIARFTFSDLCNKPLSAADYLELTGKYGTVFVESIPRMGLGERDQARRFITFIDACYENKTKLFASSEVPIFQVFSDKHTSGSAPSDGHMLEVMDDLGLDAEAVGSSSLFSSDEELFAFARCVSRLNQMGTKEWSENTAR